MRLRLAPSTEARIRRAAWWWRQRLGLPGSAAFLLLLAALAIGAWVRPSIATTRSALLRSQVARLDNAGTHVAVPAPSRDPRDAWRDALPGLSARGASIARLLRLADAARLAPARVEYSAEDLEPGCTRLRMTLPLAVSYHQARELVATLLNGLPNAALDSIELERAPSGGAALVGRLRISLFFRREAS